MSQRDLDLQQVLATELTAYQPSMFQADGEMRFATGKSTMKNSLKVEVSQCLITSPTAIVMDVSAVLWTVDWPTPLNCWHIHIRVQGMAPCAVV